MPEGEERKISRIEHELTVEIERAQKELDHWDKQVEVAEDTLRQARYQRDRARIVRNASGDALDRISRVGGGY